MPLNYSKWDQLELSDDSDIEGHPNVDKKSLIRWKQRDIHEKREVRNHRIAELDAEISCNAVLLAKLTALQAALAQAGSASAPARFSAEVERLRTAPSPRRAARPNAPKPRVARGKAGDDKDGAKLGALLTDGVSFHMGKLGEVTEQRRKEMEELLQEKAKHITSEDLHEGFESKYIPPKPAPAPVVGKGKGKSTQKEIEVLNTGGVSAAQDAAILASAAASSSKGPAAASAEDELDELPEMTPSLEEFARLPLWDFEKSWHFIQNHREVVVPGASDALLVAAFTAQNNGDSKLAKQAVHQSLLLQYGDKLGKDGLRLFFQRYEKQLYYSLIMTSTSAPNRMIQGGQAAHAIFRKDVEDTYAHVCRRVEITKQEEAAGQEQIQLVAENPETTISFNVPDGPPPENLVLEGPGTEDMDIDEVRKALQMRWDLFNTLSPALQDALKTGELVKVNKVLGSMSIPEAENAVRVLDMGGI
ncbi:hypothetical protein EVG20_g7877 [Dentipellis fragilis]|uniref:Hsp90 chaperone protein kinase-targeting subunit n=1 Tax=Dentipellis fragilis TaxID=205917 RepID=A0A4Y9YCM1_9AGAM|nr:hypothetical protein EVG20_g7877 [Dentipellis fragilis]